MRSRTNSAVVRSDTTSTTNITGFLARTRGSSFWKEAPMAGIRIFGSAMVDLEIFLAVAGASMGASNSEGLTGVHREMLDDGAERERREEG